jgi:hypothetical protein
VSPKSIAAINRLPVAEKERIYCRIIPDALLDRFNIRPGLTDRDGHRLATFRCAEGATDVVVDLRHAVEAVDPLLYAHLTDTVTGQVHVLLYIVNDPAAPRFDVDRMPDGSKTEFGTFRRNLEAEVEALAAGLAPGQVRRGLRLLSHAIPAFEAFIYSLGQTIYFVDPLAYHNAVVFEGYGFAYQQGRRRMEAIHDGFQPGGGLLAALDGSSPFRQSGMQASVRGRSWALHDGILGQPFTEIIMYKRVGHHAGVNTFPGSVW